MTLCDQQAPFYAGSQSTYQIMHNYYQKHLFPSDLYRTEITYARHRTAKSNSTSKTGIGNALARSTVPVSIPA